MSVNALPMSKGKRGPVDRNVGSPRSPKKAPKGTDTRGIHPMTKASGSVKMSRVLKGVDKSKGSKGVKTSSTFTPGRTQF